MMSRAALAAIVISAQIISTPAGAQSSARFPDLEKKLGKGWQCFAMPNGFGHIGVVFEQRPDKSVFYLDDTRSAAAATAPMAIGSLSTSKHFSLGAAFKLLSVFFPAIDASYDYSSKISATIGGAEEQVGGAAVSNAGTQWALQNRASFKPGSKVFIVREAVLASEITYAFDQATSASIAAKLDLSAPKSATISASAAVGGKAPTVSATASATAPATTPTNSGASSPQPAGTSDKQRSTVAPPDAGHRIAQTFSPKIGVCIHPDQIVIGSNYGGKPKATIVPVMDDQDFRAPPITQ